MKSKVIGVILFFIGISIIGAAVFMKYQGAEKQQKLTQDFQKTIENVDKEEAVSQANSTEKPLKEDIEAIGIMLIPKINVKVAVAEGVDMETLKYAVGHFNGTAMPGEKGNFCVAGHRSYTYNEFFNRLDEVGIGDSIIMRTKKAEYTYKVYEKKVVEPTEVSVLDKTSDATVTLVTCTPIRIATHRLIIKGRLDTAK